MAASQPPCRNLKPDADRRFTIVVNERAAPGLAVEQRSGNRIGGPAVIKIGGDQDTAGAQKPAQRQMQRRHGRVTVKEREGS